MNILVFYCILIKSVSIKVSVQKSFKNFTSPKPFIMSVYSPYQVFMGSFFEMTFGEWITDNVLLVRSFLCTMLRKAC